MINAQRLALPSGARKSERLPFVDHLLPGKNQAADLNRFPKAR